MKDDIIVTTIISIPDDERTPSEAAKIPPKAQIVIDIAKAVGNVTTTAESFAVVFKAAVQTSFPTNTFHW